MSFLTDICRLCRTLIEQQQQKENYDDDDDDKGKQSAAGIHRIGDRGELMSLTNNGSCLLTFASFV